VWRNMTEKKEKEETKEPPAEEQPKAIESTEPKATNVENAQQDSQRSSPTSQQRHSPSYHPTSEMPGIVKNPNMSPVNRPPSTTSVLSNNSGGTRTTATSRRGGRTRSRSPPAMGSRGSLNSHDSRGYPPPIDGDSNPSSAAAAAAAAAKALSNNPGGQSWSERGPYRGDDRHRSGSPRDEPSKFPGYDGHFNGSRSWPAEDHDRPPRRSGSYGHSQSIHRLPGRSGSGDLYGGRPGSYGGEHPYRGSRSGSHGMHPSYEEHPDDRRYVDRRGHYEPDMRKNGRSMSPTSDRYGPHYSYRGSVGGMAPAEGRSLSPKGSRPPSRSGSGGMSRVIGTATPIHVPRASEAPRHRDSRSGTPASVFRGRPGDGPPSSRRDDRGGAPAAEEDGPQKVLLSLRTPTTSFDEKQPAKNRKDADLPPSPDEPPQIQHSHHQHPSDFFEVWRLRLCILGECILLRSFVLTTRLVSLAAFSQSQAWFYRNGSVVQPIQPVLRQLWGYLQRCGKLGGIASVSFFWSRTHGEW
jgi:hypothetical protein